MRMHRMTARFVVSVVVTGLAAASVATAVAQVSHVALRDPSTLIGTDDSRINGDIENVSICPVDSNYVAFEVRQRESIALFVYNRTTNVLRSYPTVRQAPGFGAQEVVRSTDLDWYPLRRGGIWFAFVSNALGESQLWLGEATEGGSVPITLEGIGYERAYEPRFSPDGYVMTFGLSPIGSGDIYMLDHVDVDLIGRAAGMPALSVKPKSVVDNPFRDYGVAWYPGPQSGYFAYVNSSLTDSVRGNAKIRILIRDICEGKPLEDEVTNFSLSDFREDRYYFSPSWSPNGSGELALLMSERVPADDRATTKLQLATATVRTTNRDGIHSLREKVEFSLNKSMEEREALGYGLDPALADQTLSWTPDGRHILAPTYDRDERKLFFYTPANLWMGERPRSPNAFAPQFPQPSDIDIERTNIAFKYVDNYQNILVGRLTDVGGRGGTPDWRLAPPDRQHQYFRNYGEQVSAVTKFLRWVTGPQPLPGIGSSQLVFNSRAILFPVGGYVAYKLISNPPPPPRVFTWDPPSFPGEPKPAVDQRGGGQ